MNDATTHSYTTSRPDSARALNYVGAAVERELETLRAIQQGRACATFRAAAALGGFVGAGLLDATEIEEALVAAATFTGLSERDARSHVRRGLKRGAQTPRQIPESRGFTGTRTVPVPRPTPAVVEAPPTRPPQSEVAALWDGAGPITDDPEVEAWFCYRVTAVTLLPVLWDLARALPKSARLPRWAWSREGTWVATGHRILFRLWDHTGNAASLRARCVRHDAELKSLAPAGFSVKGLVLADPLGVQILAGAPLEWWTDRSIVVSEGEPDWLSWAALHSDARADGPAYFGLVAGGWSQQLADRIPDDTRVVVRTHHDKPGERYANDIFMTLRGRCPILRSRAWEEEER